MFIIKPDFYDSFKCIADKCSDSCCIGWEIDVDDIAFEKYTKINTSFGDEIRSQITEAEEGNYCFKLAENERCPFLNKDNLCDIIIGCGEEYLCDICREHPRFYTTLDDMIFGGVGLCCEEAARLVLSAETPEYITIETEGEGEACDGELLEIYLGLREKITEIFVDKTQSIVYLVKEVEKLVKKVQSRADGEAKTPYETREVSHKTIVEIVENSELLTDELPRLLKKSLDQKSTVFKNDTVNNYLQNILLYFLDRYLPKAVEDGDFLSKFKIALFSLKAIELLFLGEENLTLDRAVYLTKLYSKEIEYNEDNIAAIEVGK